MNGTPISKQMDHILSSRKYKLTLNAAHLTAALYTLSLRSTRGIRHKKFIVVN